MKLIHLSDLHLGKRIGEASLLEDQAYILQQILNVISREEADAVLIAGDVYDKTMPPVEAVMLFDDFLVNLSSTGIPVFIIGGNHDSLQRLAFGARLMLPSGIHIAGGYDGSVKPIRMQDVYGAVDIYLLPFVKPAHVARFCDEQTSETLHSYTEAVRLAVEKMKPDPAVRSVLVAHQFVTGAQRCESEEVVVGGLDNVDVSVFDAFDYVALGHIHGPQNIGRPTVRYCGSPLKYSFSEADHIKSVTVVELGEKGNVAVRCVPLKPLRDLRRLRGTYQQLTLLSNYQNTSVEDYLQITLTDEKDIPDAIGMLRLIYPNLLRLEYDNTRTRAVLQFSAPEMVKERSQLELFGDLYETQNNQPLEEEQIEFLRGLIEEIWEEQL